MVYIEMKKIRNILEDNVNLAGKVFFFFIISCEWCYLDDEDINEQKQRLLDYISEARIVQLMNSKYAKFNIKIILTAAFISSR